MTPEEAKNQLCKMQGEIAQRLSAKAVCLCDDPEGKPKEGEVSDEVIAELWRLLAHGRQYRKWREHADDFIHEPRTMSGHLLAIAKKLEGQDREVLEKAAEDYGSNYTLMHHFAGRCEQLEQEVRELESGAATVFRALGKRAVMGRWAVLKKTSNSGGTLFVCTVCGRVSRTPDKECRTTADPDETWGCSKEVPR